MTQNYSSLASESPFQSVDVDKPLPNRAYTDPEFFRTERDHVLAKTWVGIAFGSELRSPGYAKPVNFMGLPLVLVRDKVGEVKVFHNVCSHRGMLLVDEETRDKTVIKNEQ